MTLWLVGLFAPPAARPSPAAVPATTPPVTAAATTARAPENDGPAIDLVEASLDDGATVPRRFGRQEGAPVDVAATSTLRSTAVVVVVAAHLLDNGEADGDDGRWPEVVLACHPRRDYRVEREHAARPGEHKRDPGEDEYDVGSRVVGRRVEAHREEEREREHHTAGCGDSRPQPKDRSQTYRQFGQCDHDSDWHGKAQKVSEQLMQRANPDGCDQLGLDARGAVRVEEVWIGQLLEPGEAKGDAQEDTQRDQRPPRESQGPRRRGVEADTPPASAESLGARRTSSGIDSPRSL